MRLVPAGDGSPQDELGVVLREELSRVTGVTALSFLRRLRATETDPAPAPRPRRRHPHRPRRADRRRRARRPGAVDVGLRPAPGAPTRHHHRPRPGRRLGVTVGQIAAAPGPRSPASTPGIGSTVGWTRDVSIRFAPAFRERADDISTMPSSSPRRPASPAVRSSRWPGAEGRAGPHRPPRRRQRRRHGANAQVAGRGLRDVRAIRAALPQGTASQGGEVEDQREVPATSASRFAVLLVPDPGGPVRQLRQPDRDPARSPLRSASSSRSSSRATRSTS